MAGPETQHVKRSLQRLGSRAALPLSPRLSTPWCSPLLSGAILAEGMLHFSPSLRQTRLPRRLQRAGGMTSRTCRIAHLARTGNRISALGQTRSFDPRSSQCPLRAKSGHSSTPPSRSLIWVRLPVCPQQPVPEKINHCKFSVRMVMMNEMEFLHFPEPRKTLQAGPLHVIFLVEKDVRVERQRTGSNLDKEEVEQQNQIAQYSDEKNWNRKRMA